RRRLARNQPLALEAAQDAAEIAGIEAELAADIGRSGFLPLRELVQHACLGKGERTLQMLFFQHADLARVEAVEGAERADAAGEFLVRGSGHGATVKLYDSVNEIIDRVKYLGSRGATHSEPGHGHAGLLRGNKD